MTKYGVILAILNEEQMLVQIDDDYLNAVEPGTKLTAFALVNDKRLADLGIEDVYAPKGLIRVVMEQADGIFLAERFKEGGKVERVPIAAVELFTREVRVGAQWSAEISPNETLGIEFPKQLKAGDAVGSI